MDAAWHESLRVAVELLETRANEPQLVGLVVDREIRAVAEPRRLTAQDPAAGCVEGEDPDRPRLRPDRTLDPLAHLLRRLVRERDRQDLVRLDADRGEQVRDAVGEDARLPGARSGDDEQRTLGRQHGLALGLVQVCEVRGGLYDGHPGTLESSSYPEEVPN